MSQLFKHTKTVYVQLKTMFKKKRTEMEVCLITTLGIEANGVD